MLNRCQRACSQLFIVTSLLLLSVSLSAFEFVPPDGFAEPSVARSIMGSTYTFRHQRNEHRLMITEMPAAEIDQQFGELTPSACINLFVEEVRRTHQQFFVVAMKRPLAVGDAAFTQFRWSGDSSRGASTGVLACGRLKQSYYVFHFEDALQRAAHSFPEIRARLREFRPAP